MEKRKPIQSAAWTPEGIVNAEVPEAREEINYDSPLTDVVALMAEGNIGALTVLIQLLKDKQNGLACLLHLDDMNIRGTQIWIGFKDCCKQDLEKFKERIKSRDAAMVEIINAEGQKGNHQHQAVIRGASGGNRGYLMKIVEKKK